MTTSRDMGILLYKDEAGEWRREMTLPSRDGDREMGVLIYLTQMDLDLIEEIARERSDPKVAARLHFEEWRTGDASIDTHRLGVAGEVAVARYYGVEPNRYVSMTGEDGTGDLVVNGYKLEVKTRRQRMYDFALRGTDLAEFQYDAGVLVWRCLGGENVYEIWGVISRTRFEQVCEERDYGYGPRLVADPKHFAHPSILMRAAKQEVQDEVSIQQAD